VTHLSLNMSNERHHEHIPLSEFTLMEKRKAEKRKSIRTRGKTEADKQNVPTITASSDWLSLFRQGVNSAFILVFIVRPCI